ncbi:transcriptional repressor [Acetobacteraceae bacterium H6797]|nr:transcriptional repressor [Acetobacteraceae bacterium H6797]
MRALSADKELEHALEEAAALCMRRGASLTELRRQVLGLILSEAQPIGAYALLDRLKAERPGAAPPTVYRALDFLLDQGLVHKVERLNAYVGCAEPVADHCCHNHDHHHEHPAHDHGHPHQFLICKQCGKAIEMSDVGVQSAIKAAAERLGFHIARASVEVEGTCSECAAVA